MVEVEKKGKKREEKAEKQKKQKKERIIDIKRIEEEWEIWDENKEAVKLKAEAKKLVLKKFHKWIKVFGKKTVRMNAHKKDLGSCY